MIYLDNAAATPMYKDCVSIIEKYSCDNYFNPSALYNLGLNVSLDIESARQEILRILSGDNFKLIFTSSGSESNNTLLFGIKIPRGSRIIISAMEHSAIYNTVAVLKQRGYDVVCAKCDKYGKVDYSDYMSLLTPNTSLVSIMLVNNETGAINDIAKLSKSAKEINSKIVFHTDAVQAIGKIPVKLSTLGADAVSISGHKFHAPKGIGGLFVRKSINLTPLIYGGGQESGVRSSTENVSSIISLGHALAKTLEFDNYSYLKTLQSHLINGIINIENKALINTDPSFSAPNIVSLSLPNCRGEVLLHGMADLGVVVGTGSACSSHKGDNRIVKALNIPKEYSMGMLRISMSSSTTLQEVDTCLSALEKTYSNFRKIIK